ncbi:MAG: 2,3-bisphosphoglycerate-independent phosphoglycerate mutase [Dokdonella sp.]
MSRPRPVLLLILDGWGHRDDPSHNPIAQADLPNWRGLLAKYPHTLVQTHGEYVGLPPGQMGNSEVGHMNIGGGRVVYQDLTLIDKAIANGEFTSNPALRKACDAAKASNGTLHVFGLLSPGGVHSHEQHIFEMLRLAKTQGVGKVAVHAFLDGRDTPPRSAADSLIALDAVCTETGARVASVSGRYYAMDRDKRWDRVELAWNAIADANSPLHFDSSSKALESAYSRGENDEFVTPSVIGHGARLVDGDAVVFMNFRADRARQLSNVLVEPAFDGFARRLVRLSAFVTLTEYAVDLPVTAIGWAPQSMHNSLGEYLAGLGMQQLRIAETEKYAHVTFFFSGGREAPFDGEERILVPSAKVATYDLQPAMSCPELTGKIVDAISSERFDFIVCNIANADMVGHTGIEAAGVEAAQAVDVALGEITKVILAVGGEMLISADHGNLEQMVDDQGRPHTQHTVGPVPLVYVGRNATLTPGALSDLAPTTLALMGLEKPTEMSGHSLVHFDAS